MARYIRWFDDLSLADVPAVGGRNASLGELRREVGALGIRVPAGFAVTAAAYRRARRGAGAPSRGVDRDSALVAFDFDERDPGVLEMMRQAIAGAHRNGRHAAICGQAPSDYPEVAAFLVGLGIDALSLDPDGVLELEGSMRGAGRESRPDSTSNVDQAA